MDFELDSGQRAWRDEIRAFLRENVTPELLRERAERGFEHAGGHQAGRASCVASASPVAGWKDRGYLQRL